MYLRSFALRLFCIHKILLFINLIPSLCKKNKKKKLHISCLYHENSLHEYMTECNARELSHFVVFQIFLLSFLFASATKRICKYCNVLKSRCTRSSFKFLSPGDFGARDWNIEISKSAKGEVEATAVKGATASTVPYAPYITKSRKNMARIFIFFSLPLCIFAKVHSVRAYVCIRDCTVSTWSKFSRNNIYIHGIFLECCIIVCHCFVYISLQ